MLLIVPGTAFQAINPNAKPEQSQECAMTRRGNKITRPL